MPFVSVAVMRRILAIAGLVGAVLAVIVAWPTSYPPVALCPATLEIRFRRFSYGGQELTPRITVTKLDTIPACVP